MSRETKSGGLYQPPLRRQGLGVGLGLAFGVMLLAATAQAEQQLGSRGAQGSRWRKASVTLEVEPSVEQLGSGAFDAIVGAVSAWQDSSAFLPTVVVQRGEEDTIGYRREGPNRNIVRFSPRPDPMAKGALAITIITFDTVAERVLDADILLNGEHQFADFDQVEQPPPDSLRSAYDLQNVLTHEIGHFFGLGENMVDHAATMYAFSQPGETEKRALETVDVETISALYDSPAAEEEPAGCGGAAISSYHHEPWWLAGLALSLVVARARRRAFDSHKALGALGLTVLLSSGLPLRELAVEPMQAMRVVSTASEWEAGLIVTTLTLLPEGASAGERTVRTLGGEVDGVEQVVGHLLPPAIGQRVLVPRQLDSDEPSPWLVPLATPSRRAGE